MPVANDLACQLSDADAKGIRLASASLVEPATFEEAFEVQARTLALNGWLADGYKVAIRPDGRSVSAPMVHINRASLSGTADFARPAIDAFEVEICFVLGKDLAAPGDRPYARETLLDHVSGVFSGVEILGHRLDNGSRSPALLFLADRLGNAGYIRGEELSPKVTMPGQSYPLTISINGETVFSGPAKHPNDDPVSAFLLFANSLTSTVPMGQIITTGSLCGAIPTPPHAAISISGFTTLAVTTISTRET